MDSEWNHFDECSAEIGQQILCYDSISDCFSLGYLEDEETLVSMYVENIEADSAMEFWKPLVKPSKDLIEYYRE